MVKASMGLRGNVGVEQDMPGLEVLQIWALLQMLLERVSSLSWKLGGHFGGGHHDA